MKEVAIFSVIALIITLFIFLFEDEMEPSGIDAIKFFQRGNSPELRLIFQVLSVLLEVILLLASAIIYLTYSKKIGILSITAGLISASISIFMKMIITQPRPFWVNTDIDALACPKDFGMPSGHALNVGCSLFILTRLILKKKVILKGISIVTGVILIAVDRIFLGVHYYYQVILGFAIGLLVCSFFLDKNIKYFIVRKSKITLFFINTLCWGLFYAFLVYVTNRDYSLNHEWTTDYEQQCHKELKYADICAMALLQASLLCLFAGFYSGLVPDYSPIYTNKKHFILTILCASCLGGLVFLVCYLLTLGTTKWEIFIVISLVVYGYGFVFARYIPALMNRFQSTKPHLELRFMDL